MFKKCFSFYEFEEDEKRGNVRMNFKLTDFSEIPTEYWVSDGLDNDLYQVSGGEHSELVEEIKEKYLCGMYSELDTIIVDLLEGKHRTLDVMGEEIDVTFESVEIDFCNNILAVDVGLGHISPEQEAAVLELLIDEGEIDEDEEVDDIIELFKESEWLDREICTRIEDRLTRESIWEAGFEAYVVGAQEEYIDRKNEAKNDDEEEEDDE